MIDQRARDELGASPGPANPCGDRLASIWVIAPGASESGPFTLGGDGIAVDCAGNVYIQSGAIISPQNQTIGHFPGGTNMAFGGAEGKTLLVVGGTGMHTVQMNLPGHP